MATQSKKRQPKSERPSWWALPVACLMLAIIAGGIMFAIREIANYRNFKVMRNTVDTDRFYSGVYVENYDLSSLTLPEALDYWARYLEPEYRERTVTLVYGTQSWKVPVNEVGYTSNYQSVLEEAWAQGRSGTLEQRYRDVMAYSLSPIPHSVTRVLVDEAQLRARIQSIIAPLDTGAADAAVKGFDVNTRTFQFSEGNAGMHIDVDRVYEEVVRILVEGSGTIVMESEFTQPEVTADELAQHYGLITSAVTNASSSTANRLSNIRLALSSINGYALAPGESFSFNGVVGERTKARGYKKATVFSDGELDEDYGGGICQVSTTLFNAAMKADLEMVKRQPHSRPVSYVSKGKDAAVNWPNQDMVFKNTTDETIYIVAYLSDNKRVYCDIYGRQRADGITITVETQTTETLQPGAPRRTVDVTLPSGTSKEVTPARQGYKAVAYRVYWDASGNEIERKLLCRSTYAAASAVIAYAP